MPLAFNLGYPNAYDRFYHRTGDFLMIHGNCVSIGCYAMTNAGIEEIYLLGQSSLADGQSTFPVHIFPFRPTDTAMMTHKTSVWSAFWRELKPAYDAFARTKKPPETRASGGHYVVRQ